MGFKDAFSEEEEKELEIGPEAWQRYIDSRVPNGFYYEYIGNGGYQLVSESQGLKFKFNIKIPEDLKAVNLESGEDLQKLIHRSQRKFEVEVKDIIAGERSIAIEELVQTFGDDIQHKYDKVYLLPRPFSSPTRISVKFNDTTYYFSFQQMAYPSLTKVIFESEENNIIHIKLIID
ncbi:MAG: abortive infection system toxin AbiGii family protein, partial [Staphylococcus equorum]|nr:abortive infection system toxin AbiGii family protein [Staphylococcus equorum]